MPQLSSVTRTTIAAAVIAVLAVACIPKASPGGTTPKPAPPAASCPTAASTSGGGGTAPMSSTQAAAEATAEFDAAADQPAGDVQLVTVESTDSGPRVVSREVDSAADARTVARAAAQGSDLLAVESDERVRIEGAPDPYRSSQWALNATTFTTAWSRTTGAGIKVAVVDTGVQSTHPDLSGRVATGWQFLNNSTAGVSGGRVDDHGHGTHVAGVIAAVVNNGIGIAGAASGVTIIPVKVLDSAGSGWSSDVARGINWAANQCAKVINLSLGGPSPSSVIDSAITYARSKGAVVVAAAGNAGASGSPPSYPGATTGVIAVAAVDSNLLRASFSNQGTYVDISAPGVNVLSTLPPARYSSGYGSWSGTSMATPYVSAAAAMVKAVRPACTPDGVETRLKSSATALGSARPNIQYGMGLVNPNTAITIAGC